MVSSAWLETLLSAIDALPKETIRQEVMRTFFALLSHCCTLPICCLADSRRRKWAAKTWLLLWCDRVCRSWAHWYRKLSSRSPYRLVWPAVASWGRWLPNLSHQCESPVCVKSEGLRNEALHWFLKKNTFRKSYEKAFYHDCNITYAITDTFLIMYIFQCPYNSGWYLRFFLWTEILTRHQ